MDKQLRKAINAAANGVLDGAHPGGYGWSDARAAFHVISECLAPAFEALQAENRDLRGTLDATELPEINQAAVDTASQRIADLDNEVARLKAVVENQVKALANWRREADRDAGELARLRGDGELFDWWERHLNYQHGTDWESGEVVIYRLTGNVNDRQYDEVARAETLREALSAVREPEAVRRHMRA